MPQPAATTGLKAQGKYLARTLSFAETTFGIQQVPLADEFKKKYDALAQVWYVCAHELVNVEMREGSIGPE
jgi:hypothetical protein